MLQIYEQEINPRKLLCNSVLLGGGFAGLAGMMEVNGAVGQINIRLVKPQIVKED